MKAIRAWWTATALIIIVIIAVTVAVVAYLVTINGQMRELLERDQSGQTCTSDPFDGWKLPG